METTKVGSQEPTSVTREYVYGPGYVDEVVCQLENPGEPNARTFYYLQDANYNVVALTDGASGVVTQYTYEPYGPVAALDRPSAGGWPKNPLGHQGLFFERFYRADDSGQSPVTVNRQPLLPGVKGLYYNRNRWYNPKLGRFLQRDMNETALLVQAALAMNGETFNFSMGAMNPKGQYRSGMNLYQYAGGNPVNRRDPTGLFSILGLLGVGGLESEERALEAGASMTTLGYFRSLAAAWTLRNEILSGIVATASRLDPSRALVYLDRAARVLNNTAGRIFNANTYQAGYQWLMNGLQAGYRVHHIFPQKFAEFFESKGINVHLPTFLTEVEEGVHARMSYAYNAAWDGFIRRHGQSATVDRVFQFARDLLAEYGLEVPW